MISRLYAQTFCCLPVVQLVSDKPITSEAEDLLGLAPFADALAKSLSEMTPDDGLVISVQGEWGSGKTSAIELAQRRLIIRELAKELGESVENIEQRNWDLVESDWASKAATRNTHIVRFNPWNFSGQENLVRAFFAEVGAAIGHPADGRISKAINKITNHLPAAGSLIGGIVGGVASGGAAIGAGSTLGRAAAEGAQKFFDNSSSLEAAKRELASALREQKKRVIVIIDDLDRLLPSEMRSMFSLVKSLGDLPGVFYVLSFDENAISAALKKSAESFDPAFLEKIIQVPLRLPPPWQPEVTALLFGRINSIIGAATPADQSRWQHAFLDAVQPYIQTPRNVARFANTLQVIWPNVAGDVDLTDLVILVTLQLFEPKAYELVFENIELLSGDKFSLENEKDLVARFDLKDVNSLQSAKKALSHLFPKLSKGWNSYVNDGTVYLKKREQRRICTSEYYRNYFLFGRDPDRVSRDEIESILCDKNPKRRLKEIIARLADRKSRKDTPRVGALLDQLLEVVFSKPLLSNAAVSALLDLSDELIARKDIEWQFFVTENIERLDSILRFGLEPLSAPDRIERARLIASHPNGLTMCITVIERLAGQHGLYGKKASFEHEKLIPLTEAKKAARKVLARVRKASKDGSLLQTPSPMRLVWSWRRLTTQKEVKDWLARQLKSEKSTLALARAIPQISYQSSGAGQKIVRSFKSESYKEILDTEALKKRLEKISCRPDASSDAKRICAEFLEAERLGRES